MHAITGAILILAASVLVAAGIIADGVNQGFGRHGTLGYIPGGILGFFGILVFMSRWMSDMAAATKELVTAIAKGPDIR